MPSTTPSRVTIVEVGPRDGLQNDPRLFPVEARVAFIEALAAAGCPAIETGSFVSPKAVPQMASSDEVMQRLDRREGVRYIALVPNEKGYERAREVGVDAIALFASATEAFSQANLRASIDESFDRFAPVAERAKADGAWVRGYVSVAFHCPYAGPTEPEQALAVARRLLELGCDEISIADTIGHATPDEVDRLVALAVDAIPLDRLALHLHDTSGQALANVDAALTHGVSIFDSAAGGMGGCPYAPGAPGNLATEALVTHLDARGIATGVDAAAVARAVDELIGQAVTA
jgi:isopropylmalate/homocitrate/citramalate synthase